MIMPMIGSFAEFKRATILPCYLGLRSGGLGHGVRDGRVAGSCGSGWGEGEVIAMLRRPEGATVDEVATAMGWQRHTVRGLFSGTLKKKLGLTVASAQEERGRVYRLAAPEQA
jgi:hypothetical protein